MLRHALKRKIHGLTSIFLGLGIIVSLAGTPVMAADSSQPVSPGETTINGAPFVPGELLVKVKPGVSPSDIARGVDAQVVTGIGDGTIQLLKLRSGAVSTAVQKLAGTSGVLFAEPNWLLQFQDSPNDTAYNKKWDLNNNGTLSDGTDVATNDADMDWQEAYTLLGSGFSGSATIAILDTGVDLNHPDLDGKLIAGWDFLDNDATPADTYGHGTHVAGIAAAETNNSLGTAGVAYGSNIKIMPLRVGDQNGIPTSASVDAIYYAANNGANVINMSYGGRFGSSSEQQAINYAWGKGVVVVASAGNDGTSKISYPAAFTNCIAVGATNWHDQLSSYSNHGSALDVVAPGGDMSGYGDVGGIYSTMPTYDVYLTTSYSYQKNYDYLQGTSMAAPEVTGLAGLLFAVGVTDTNSDGRINDEIRNIIQTTTDDLGAAGWDSTYGWGRVNVYKAVQAAQQSGDAPPTVSITSPASGVTVSGTIGVTATANDDNGVAQVEFFVDGSSIGVDNNGSDGWSASWDTTASSEGTHSLSAMATDTIGQTTASSSVSVTVDNVPSPVVTVTGIKPSSMRAGTTITVTIYGSGFASGATVTFVNGSGPAPTATVTGVKADGNEIYASVSVKSGGPKGNLVWDVRVANTDGSSGVLSHGFTITR
jgi:thermitase